MKMTHATLEDKRALLDSFGGKFYSLKWVKKDGTERECTARHMQHDMFTLGHASKALGNPCGDKPHLYTCVDSTNEKWVNVDLNNLKAVKCNGKEYEFE